MSNSSPPFQEFCQLLDKISAKQGEKKRLIQNYIQKWVVSYGMDVFDAIRLLIPEADDRKYNLKEDRLATLLIKSLLIDPKSTDGIRLKKYKAHTPDNPNAGNFPLIVYEEVKKRSPVTSSDQTVKQTNEYLDRLANNTENDQTVIFKEILSKYTAHQIQWIIRIILKELNIQCRHKTVLDALHEGAYDIWNTNNSLKDICRLDLYQERKRTTAITLFNMLLPQLCQSFTENLFEQMAKPVYVEKKLDGERVIMHFDREQDRFMWHSRKRLLEDHFYGTSSNDMTKLSGHIHKGIMANKVVLDGEMLAYDPTTQKFLPFGTLKDAIKSRNINDPSLPHPCYVVFDIIHFNGTDLAGYRLQDRLKILENCIVEQNMHLKFIERKPRNTKEEIYSDLEQALLDREEGLVLKDVNSTYVVNHRSPYWLKYKPSYTDSLVDSCDLLLVGAKFGSGKRGGKLSSILCAVRDDRIPDTQPPRFVTFTLAGSGLSSDALRQLDDKIKTVTDHSSQRPPIWLDHPKKSGEPFDKIVDYQDGVVVEIKGGEIVESQKFGLECTLRFPAFVRFRPDKGWQDIMTYNDVIKTKSEGLVGKKRKGNDSIERMPVKKANRVINTVLESQQGLDPKGVKIKTDIFQGKRFFVISGINDEITKNDIEKLIKQNGGDYSQNRPSADILIAGKSIRLVRAIINRVKTQDILYPSYIFDCIDANRLLPIAPKYMYYTSPQTEQAFLNYMDVYHDTYAKKITPKDLMQVMDLMKDPENVSDNKQALSVVERYYPEGLSGMLFVNTIAYFDFDQSMSSDNELLLATPAWVEWKRRQEEMELAKARFEFEAGTIASTMEDARITHVILHERDLSRLDHLTKTFLRDRLPRFVTLDWIIKSFEQETLLHEADYDPKYHVDISTV